MMDTPDPTKWFIVIVTCSLFHCIVIIILQVLEQTEMEPILQDVPTDYEWDVLLFLFSGVIREIIHEISIMCP